MRSLFLSLLVLTSSTATAQLTESSGTIYNTNLSSRLVIGSNSIDAIPVFQIHSSNKPTLAIGKGNANTTGEARLLFNAGDGVAANGFWIKYIKSPSTDRLAFVDGSGVVEPLTIRNGGNIGIGTNSPEHLLQLHSANNPTLAIGKENYVTAGKATLKFNSGGEGVANVFSLVFNKTLTTDHLAFVDGGGITRLSIFNGGKIGINTTDVDEALTVKGKIHTSEVRVDLEPEVVPDYVFENDYQLTPLTEVEAFVKMQKHLPDVPSATEMSSTGMQLKEMNLILLKKVEELTLHAIEFEKKNSRLQEQLIELEKKNSQLKEQLTELDALKKKISAIESFIANQK